MIWMLFACPQTGIPSYCHIQNTRRENPLLPCPATFAEGHRGRSLQILRQINFRTPSTWSGNAIGAVIHAPRCINSC